MACLRRSFSYCRPEGRRYKTGAASGSAANEERREILPFTAAGRKRGSKKGGGHSAQNDSALHGRGVRICRRERTRLRIPVFRWAPWRLRVVAKTESAHAWRQFALLARPDCKTRLPQSPKRFPRSLRSDGILRRSRSRAKAFLQIRSECFHRAATWLARPRPQRSFLSRPAFSRRPCRP